MNTIRYPLLLLVLAFIIVGCEPVSRLETILQSPQKPPSAVACTQEAKQCPDGSYVGRTGPDCQFAPCPVPTSAVGCTSDADCPSSAYVCQATEGTGTVYPGNSQPSVTRIIKGECKLKAGNACDADANCVAGLVCHAGSCTNPRGAGCDGLTDTSCPAGYRCIQSCGPPVARNGDPPPPYFCEVNEVADQPKNCPICLASNTLIATPSGSVVVQDIKVGTPVWSLNKNGEKVASSVISVGRAIAPKTHQVVHLVLSDHRSVWVSPNHPLVNGLSVGDLKVGDLYDQSAIESVVQVPYWYDKTYDILPGSDTGYYWANGILLGSTLAP